MNKSPKRSYKYHCKTCQNKLQKWGKTSAGSQRWRCMKCSSTGTHKRLDLSRGFVLEKFVLWPTSKDSQAELDVPSRTFRDQTPWC